MAIYDYIFSLVFPENQLNSAILGLLDIGDTIHIHGIGDIKDKRDISDIRGIG
jgi:hypothetical protein